MPYAKLTIDLPEVIWIGEVSRFGLLEIESDSLPAVIEAVESRNGLTSLRVMQRSDDTAVTQFETDEPLLLLSIRDSGAPLELPLTIRDGRALIELTASRDRLSEFGDQLETFGMSYTLNAVYDAVEQPTLLTDQQRELLVTAVELGYYDTPRECTLTELADGMGLAKSTASVTLHRAEEAVIKEYVVGQLERPLDHAPRAAPN